VSDTPEIRTERDGRVLRIVVDHERTKNAFVPETMLGRATR
jgi:hypothetical protein